MDPKELRERALDAANAFLRQQLPAAWTEAGYQAVSSLEARPPTPADPRWRLELRYGDHRRALAWENAAGDPLHATLEPSPPTVVTSKADLLVLLAGAAMCAQRPVESCYACYGETYRAFPDGRIELVETKKRLPA